MTDGSRAPLVLIAEDFQDARELYRDYLEYCGFAVATAENGREAVDMTRALQPDLVLMDASMPILDGWEATRILKKDPQTRSIPIVALTAHAFDDARREAMDVGCDAFITKPCPPDDLVREIKTVLATNSSAAGRRRRR